jgi:ABC-type amino acid transport substrate-binding protein
MTYLWIAIITLIIAYAAYLICTGMQLTSTINSLILAIGTGLTTGALLLFMTHGSESKQSTNTLIVGTSPDFPPYCFIENEKLVGFEIDVIKEVGKHLNKDITFKTMPFTTLIPSLQLGSLQVVASGLTSTPERAKTVLMCRPHTENNPLVIVSLKSAPALQITDLHGKQVIVNEGYTAEAYLSTIPNIHLTRLKTVADAFLALKGGRADAFVTAEGTIKPFFDQKGSDEFLISPIAGTQENCCIAIAPKYPELVDEIESALEEMKKDGTLKQLKTKWGL